MEWLIFALVAGALACTLYLLLPDVTYCQTDHTSQPPKENCSSSNLALITLWQSIKFLDDHSGAITALSGIAVAWFTCTLWGSTRQLWQSAEKQRIADLDRRKIDETAREIDAVRLEGSLKAAQDAASATGRYADIMLGIQIPRLVITDIRITDAEADFKEALQRLRYEIVWINLGATPAVVQTQGSYTAIGIPETFRFSFNREFSLHPPMVIDAHHTYSITHPGMQNSILDGDANNILTYNDTLVLHVVISYADFTGSVRRIYTAHSLQIDRALFNGKRMYRFIERHREETAREGA